MKFFGFHHSKPVRHKHSNVNIKPKVCKLDGKTFCKPNDKPLKPALAYTGGKSRLADTLIKKMPPHKVYNEVFAGSGAVFFKKPLAQKSILNDKDHDIIKVHRAFKNGRGFSQCNIYPSRQRFNRIKNKSNKSACDIAYLNKTSFGAQMKTYALSSKKTCKECKKRFAKRKDLGIKYQKAHTEDYKDKLKSATILNQDFSKVMQKYDSKDTFHYLDPPYVVGGDSYKVHGVTPKDVCDVAKKMKGKVMISYDNHPEVRKSCKGLKIRKVDARYTLQAHENFKPVKEVLITNY